MRCDPSAPTSFDDTLLLMFIPWSWLVLICVERAQGGLDLQSLNVPLLLFAAVLGPLTFMHTFGAQPIHIEGPVRCLAILGLMTYAASKAVVRDPMAVGAESAVSVGFSGIS